MTDKPEPTAEHIDAVARAPRLPIGLTVGLRSARAILTSTDPAVHAAQAASLPTDVMLTALVERGALRETRRDYAGHGEAWVEARLSTGWRVVKVENVRQP